MNKKEAFINLCREVSECHLCETMPAKSYCANSEILINDDHGLDTDKPYVNLWNLWQGNLDADIMVIGQDFGHKDDNAVCLHTWQSGEYNNPTDCALRRLFYEVFGIDIDQKDLPLFFTNAANCYRKYKTTGGMHGGWLPICVNKFMARLIRIVRPKMIIVLGQAAFESLFCMEELPIRCSDVKGSKGNAFSDVMQNRYEICEGDWCARVFPVYHPGANSNRNRTDLQQKQDWERIRDIMETYKGENKQ